MQLTISQLEQKAKIIRRHIIEMIYQSGSGHPGGSLSCVDILVALYFYQMRHDPNNPRWEDRDRFVLSKGHAAPALYAVLAEAGYFSIKGKFLRKFGSILQGHPDANRLSAIEVSSGSLGQGLSIACGIALSAKLEKKHFKTYVLLGDGECQEGQIWEAAMFASHYNLDNLIAIVDRNDYQIDGRTEDVMSLEDFADKWKSFGWNVIEIDGHNFRDMIEAFQSINFNDRFKDKPTVIIANTTKGCGVCYMEDNNDWHGKAPNKEETDKALKELL